MKKNITPPTESIAGECVSFFSFYNTGRECNAIFIAIVSFIDMNWISISFNHTVNYRSSLQQAFHYQFNGVLKQTNTGRQGIFYSNIICI
jgi:hypothetical protein